MKRLQTVILATLLSLFFGTRKLGADVDMPPEPVTQEPKIPSSGVPSVAEDDNSPSLIMKNADTDDGLITYIGRVKDPDGYVELYRSFKGSRIIRNVKTPKPGSPADAKPEESLSTLETAPETGPETVPDATPQ